MYEKFFLLFLTNFFLCTIVNGYIRPEAHKSKQSFSQNHLSLLIQENKSKFGINNKNIAHLAKVIVQNINYLADTTNNNRSVRTVKNRLGLSAKTVGNLALFSLVTYGAISTIAPSLGNEISRNLNTEEKQGIQKIINKSLVGVSESFMGWVERSVNDLPSLPRLNAQECMKRCICEAHNQPKKYGLIGLSLQLFFPPYVENTDSNKTVSKYQLAAQYGRGENANCATHFDDCMINFLDIFQSFLNLVF